MYDTIRTSTGGSGVVVMPTNRNNNKRIIRKSLSMGAPNGFAGVITSTGNSPPNSHSDTRKKGMRGMLKRSFSFGLKKSISKRSLTPMKQRRESNDADSVSSSSSTELERSVRFVEKGRSKKIKAKVWEFQPHDPNDTPLLWYTEADMHEIMEDVKNTVKHYLIKCERYIYAMDRITQECDETVTEQDTITDQFDAHVLEQLSNAAARGLEHHIAPRSNNTRRQIVQHIIATQCELNKCHLSKDEKEQKLAQQYSRLARTAKLVAKTMADGDAMVARNEAKALSEVAA